MERAKGIEPSTYSLGSCRSTTELRPRWITLALPGKGFNDLKNQVMAERGRFELPIQLPVCRISSAVLSTTQPPLRVCRFGPETKALWWLGQ